MCIQKATILPFILLTLVQVSSATAQAVPPPLPESAWVNRTTLNYTELHDKYAASFQCMYYPTGVYGFYYGWIVNLSMALTLNATIWGNHMQGRFFPILNFLSSLPPTAFSLFLLNRNVSAFHSCEIYSHNKEIHRFGIFGNVTAGMWAAGSVAFLINAGLKSRAILWLGAVLLMFGMMLQIVFIGINYICILHSLKINTMKPDMVSPRARLAIFVPFGISVALGNLNSLWAWWTRVQRTREIYESYETDDTNCCNVMQTLAANAMAIMAGVCHGIGALRIGNIIGDPWGRYSVQGVISIMDAVMAGAVPVLQLLLLYACKRAGKLAYD